MPFIPKKEIGRWIDDATGREFGSFTFSCTMLLPNGRCRIYQDRPHACRVYDPGQDSSCVHHGAAESGADEIPEGHEEPRFVLPYEVEEGVDMAPLEKI